MAQVVVDIPDEYVEKFNHCINEESIDHPVDWDLKQFLVRAFGIAVFTYENELDERRKLESIYTRKKFSDLVGKD